MTSSKLVLVCVYNEQTSTICTGKFSAQHPAPTTFQHTRFPLQCFSLWLVTKLDDKILVNKKNVRIILLKTLDPSDYPLPERATSPFRISCLLFQEGQIDFSWNIQQWISHSIQNAFAADAIQWSQIVTQLSASSEKKTPCNKLTEHYRVLCALLVALVLPFLNRSKQRWSFTTIVDTKAFTAIKTPRQPTVQDASEAWKKKSERQERRPLHARCLWIFRSPFLFPWQFSLRSWLR